MRLFHRPKNIAREFCDGQKSEAVGAGLARLFLRPMRIVPRASLEILIRAINTLEQSTGLGESRSGSQMKAVILLGINYGFGKQDVPILPIESVDLEGDWGSDPRPR